MWSVSRERVGSMLLRAIISYNYVSGWTNMQRVRFGSILLKVVRRFICFFEMGELFRGRFEEALILGQRL